jgi:protein-S-isoprenylcysteine O-methyltransferase Ste14
VRPLARQALGANVRFLLFLAILLLVVSGDIAYWQLWIFLAVLAVSMTAITAYLLRNDPVLLQRRMAAGPKAETDKAQRVIMGFGAVLFFAFAVLPGFDHRFGWSHVPPALVILGDVVAAAGMLMAYLVFRENTFAAATVAIHPDQKVISSGPYAIVRHPMYSGALVFVLGMSLALGSWWALLLFPAIAAVLAWRLVEEEKLLSVNLPGYQAYRERLRYRLVPFIW